MVADKAATATVRIPKHTGIVRGLRLRSLRDQGFPRSSEPRIIVADPSMARSLSEVKRAFMIGDGLMTCTPRSSAFNSNGEKPMYRAGLEASPAISSHQAPPAADTVRNKTPPTK